MGRGSKSSDTSSSGLASRGYGGGVISSSSSTSTSGTVRTSEGTRVPRPSGDPSGEGYARQYSAYQQAGGDVSNVVTPTYKPPEQVVAEKQISSGLISGYGRASQRAMAEQGMTVTMMGSVRPSQPRTETVTTREPLIQTKFTPYTSWFQKAVSQESRAGLYERISGWEQKITGPVTRWFYPEEKEAAKLERERELRLISLQKRMDIEIGGLKTFITPEGFGKEKARLEQKGYVFTPKDGQYVITQKRIEKEMQPIVVKPSYGKTEQFLRGTVFGAVTFIPSLSFTVAKGIVAPFSTIKEIGTGVKAYPSYIISKPYRAAGEITGTLVASYGLGKLGQKLTQPKIKQVRVRSTLEELKRTRSEMGITSEYKLKGISRTKLESVLGGKKVLEYGMKGKAFRFTIQEIKVGAGKKGQAPVLVTAAGKQFKFTIPEVKLPRLYSLAEVSKKPSLGVSGYVISGVKGKPVGFGVSYDITALYKKGALARSLSIGKVAFQKGKVSTVVGIDISKKLLEIKQPYTTVYMAKGGFVPGLGRGVYSFWKGIGYEKIRRGVTYPKISESIVKTKLPPFKSTGVGLIKYVGGGKSVSTYAGVKMAKFGVGGFTETMEAVAKQQIKGPAVIPIPKVTLPKAVQARVSKQVQVQIPKQIQQPISVVSPISKVISKSVSKEIQKLRSVQRSSFELKTAHVLGTRLVLGEAQVFKQAQKEALNYKLAYRLKTATRGGVSGISIVPPIAFKFGFVPSEHKKYFSPLILKGGKVSWRTYGYAPQFAAVVLGVKGRVPKPGKLGYSPWQFRPIPKTMGFKPFKTKKKGRRF